MSRPYFAMAAALTIAVLFGACTSVDKSIFPLQQVTVEVRSGGGDGNGIVTAEPASMPPSIHCVITGGVVDTTTLCSETFSDAGSGGSFQLQAVPAAGSRLVSWSGCEGGPGPSPGCNLSFAQGADVTFNVTARFEVDTPPPPPPPATNTIVWTGGAGTSDWSTPGNWDLNRAPAAADSVIVSLAGATVEIGEPAPGVPAAAPSISALVHTAGTIWLRGPDNCPNCLTLTVQRAVRSSGPDTRMIAQRAQILYGAPSTYVTLSSGGPGDGGALVGPEGMTSAPPAVTIERLDGFFQFAYSRVTITGDSDVSTGIGLDRGASLTIGSGATVEVTLTPGVSDGSIGISVADTLVVAGTLRVTTSQFDFGHVIVESGGVLETMFARVRGGMVNRGTVRGPTASGGLIFLGGGIVLEEGSVLAADQMTVRAPIEVRGRLEVRSILAAEQLPWSFVVEGDADLDVGALQVGLAPVRLGATGGSSLLQLTSIVGAGASPSLIEVGGGGLSVETLHLNGRGMAGAGALGIVNAGRVQFFGFDGVPLDRIQLTIQGPIVSNMDGSTATGARPIVVGSNGTRIVQMGQLRLSNARLAPGAGTAPGQFYFDHVGQIQPLIGASSITACINPGGTVIAGGGTLAMSSLPASQC